MIWELLARPCDVEHDNPTVRLYPKKVALQCTCGFHSPPPGLAENKDAHITTCGYRAFMAKVIND